MAAIRPLELAILRIYPSVANQSLLDDIGLLTRGVSSGQVSDALTSHMARPQFERACELLGLPPQSDDCWTGLCQQQQRDEGRPVDRHSLRTLHAIACLVYTLGSALCESDVF